MSGTDAAIEALGEVIAAYKARIVQLEAIVAQQQSQLEATKNSPEENHNGATPVPSTPAIKESV